MQVARNHYKEMDGIPETPDNSDVKTKMKKKITVEERMDTN